MCAGVQNWRGSGRRECAFPAGRGLDVADFLAPCAARDAAPAALFVPPADAFPAGAPLRADCGVLPDSCQAVDAALRALPPCPRACLCLYLCLCLWFSLLAAGRAEIRLCLAHTRVWPGLHRETK